MSTVSETRSAPMRLPRVLEHLAELLAPLARERGLTPVRAPFPLGDAADYRVTDGGLVRPGPREMCWSTAALVVELVWFGDDPWEKLPFYATRGVDELLIVDRQERRVHWLALQADGEYGPVDRSSLIALGPDELTDRLDWPE